MSSIMDELDNVLKKYTNKDQEKLNGAVFVAVDKNGKVLYSRAAGQRTVATNRAEPVDADSVFWIASLTKLSTAIAVMIAVEKGLTGLDDNVREVVPELENLDILRGFGEDGVPQLEKCTEPITLRQLLSHSSGFIYDVQHEGLKRWSTYANRKENTFTGSYVTSFRPLVPHIANPYLKKGYLHPLVFEPDAGWAYGPGMDWAGRTVELLSGQFLEEFMKENIWSKLSMDSTTFRPELRDDFPSRRMELCWRDPKDGLIPSKVPLGNPAEDCCGGVGLYSTPNDQAKLLASMLSRDGRILMPSSVSEIMKPQLRDNKHFVDVVCGSKRAHLGQTWPLSMSGSFGLSSSINASDFPGRRAKKSANWQGMPGVHAWIDPQSGVAGGLFTQVLPPGDAVVTSCLLELEAVLYKELGSLCQTSDLG